MTIEYFPSAGALAAPWANMGSLGGGLAVANVSGSNYLVNATTYQVYGSFRNDWNVDDALARINSASSPGSSGYLSLHVRATATSLGYEARVFFTGNVITRIRTIKDGATGSPLSSLDMSVNLGSVGSVDLDLTLTAGSPNVVTARLLDSSGNVIAGTTTAGNDAGTILDNTGAGVGVAMYNAGTANALRISALTDGELISAPTFSVAPAVDSALDIDAVIDFTAAQDGTVYLIVIGDGETAPTAQQIVDGANYTGATVVYAGSVAVTAGVENSITATGLSASSNYDVYAVPVDTGNNQGAVSSVLNLATIAPIMRITGASDTTPNAGDSVTLNLSGANASGKTLATAAGAVTIDSQDANTIVFTMPDPTTLAALHNTAITFTVTDGADTFDIDLTVGPATGYTLEQIAALTGVYTNDTDVAISDYVYWRVVSGAGVFAGDSGGGSPDPGSSLVIGYNVWDVSASAWSGETTATFGAPADLEPVQHNLGADIEGANPGQVFTGFFSMTGVDDGESVTYVGQNGMQVSSDQGATWATSRTFVANVASPPRVDWRVTAGTYDAVVNAILTANGVSDSITIVTRSAVAPVVTLNPQNQSVAAGATVTLNVAFTGADTIQWYKDAAPLSGETAASLVFTSTVGDNGSGYYAIGTNSDGSTQSATATLTVSAPDVTAPSFTALPSVPSPTTTGGTLTATVDETSSIKVVVTSQSASEPTEAAFNASLISASASADTQFTVNLSGLTAGSSYRAWVEATDASSNRTVESVDFSTAAGAASVVVNTQQIVDVETKASQASVTLTAIVRNPTTLAALLTTSITTNGSGIAAISSTDDVIGTVGASVLVDFADPSGQRHMYPATIEAA